MRNYFVALLVVFGLCLAIPAQAQSEFDYAKQDLYQISDRAFADHDWRMCKRHEGSGDAVELSRCYGIETDSRGNITGRHKPAFQFYNEMHGSRRGYGIRGYRRDYSGSYSSRNRYGRGYGYRGYGRNDRRADIDTLINLGHIGVDIWQGERTNRNLKKLIEQEARTQELLAERVEQEYSPETTEKEEAHARIPQTWINRTGSYTICTKDRGSARWTTVLPGTKVDIEDATPDPEFGVKWMIIQSGCKCNDEVVTPVDSCNPGFRRESGNVYSIVCGR